MKITLEQTNIRYPITHYTDTTITAGQQEINDSAIITPKQLFLNWDVHHVTDLTLADLKPIFELKPTILLLGTGSQLTFPNTEITHQLLIHHIGIEVMTNGAACRTYNVLTSEYRDVIIAVIFNHKKQ